MIKPQRRFDITDTVNAWVEHGKFVIDGAPHGRLAGLKFAVKDVFDVAGYPTGFGNPTWLATHDTATLTSPVVQSLLDAGAALYGKVITDELTYSLNGDNKHYGTPLNSKAPDSVPGGSSSGSAAVAAADLVDFAVGTDTGGSVRVPASYCGVWGLRTTHGAVPVAGVVPLQRSFDTVGWFASHADVFEKVGEVLLPATTHQLNRIVHVDMLWQLADAELLPGLREVEDQLERWLGCKPVPQALLASDETLEDWRRVYHVVSAREGWLEHGSWIERHKPDLGEAIANRFKYASTVTEQQASEARQRMAEIRARVRQALGDDGVLVLPSSASTAPRLDARPEEVDDVRMRTMRITCVAGLAGLPQVSIPFMTSDSKPYGVSLLGPAGSDLALLRLARKLHEAI